MATENETEETDDTGNAARSFTRLVERIGNGDIVAEASDELHALAAVVEGLAETQGKASGTLTLKITLACNMKGTFTISGDIAVKNPKPVRADARMWRDKTGNLVEVNPAQANLPNVRTVPGNGKARKIEATS